MRRYLISFKEVNKSVEILILTEGREYFLVIISYIGIFVTPVFLFFFHFLSSFGMKYNHDFTLV